ncbi:MAG: gamma-glutamylcyclotransferase [Verrucomicrobiales bacterium]|nr:gamma-glutamylcyclotransferase [Verrucomicrobiales bacterium]
MNVFVYGTLLVPEIWELVTGRSGLSSQGATLKGHSIWRVQNATFPAIKEEAESEAHLVPGRVFQDVPPDALQRLDSYEDSFYERVEVVVETSDGPLKAQVYRAPAAKAAEIISSDTWTLDWFEKNALARFLENVFDH